MNFSKPAGVVGGGEMNFATSSVESTESSVFASLFASSRSIMRWPWKIGSPLVQSVTSSISGTTIGASKRIGSRFVIACSVEIRWVFIGPPSFR